MKQIKQTMAMLLFAGLALSACGSNGQVEQLNQQGNAAFANQDYAAATTAYTQALTEDPAQAAVAYNLANTHYRQEEYEQAQAAMQAALPQADAELTAKGHYNIGNALYSSEQYEGAVEAYKEALRIDPADADAKHNLELALSKLQQQQDQQNQDQQNQEQQSQDQQSQDQQSQDQQSQDQQSQEQQNQDQQNQDQQNQDQQNQDQQNQDQQNQDQQNQDQQSQDQQNQDQQNQDQQNQDQQNQDQQQPGQAGGTGEEQPADPNAQPGPAVRIDGLTEQQARQMLVAAAQGTKTLQEYLQQVYVFPSGAVEKDW